MSWSVMLAAPLARGAGLIGAGVFSVGRMGSLIAVVLHVTSTASTAVPRRAFMNAPKPARQASRLHKIKVRNGEVILKTSRPHPAPTSLL